MAQPHLSICFCFIIYLLFIQWSRGLNSGCQVWQQAHPPAKTTQFQRFFLRLHTELRSHAFFSLCARVSSNDRIFSRFSGLTILTFHCVLYWPLASCCTKTPGSKPAFETFIVDYNPRVCNARGGVGGGWETHLPPHEEAERDCQWNKATNSQQAPTEAFPPAAPKPGDQSLISRTRTVERQTNRKRLLSEHLAFTHLFAFTVAIVISEKWCVTAVLICTSLVSSNMIIYSSIFKNVCVQILCPFSDWVIFS